MVVLEERSGRKLREMEVAEEATQIDALVGSSRRSNKLGFRGGARSARLFLGTPGNGIVAKKEDEATDRFTIVEILGPVRIRESTKSGCRLQWGMGEGHGKRRRTTKVSKQVFGVAEMTEARILDILGEGLTRKRDVRASVASEVESRADDVAVDGAIDEVGRSWAILVSEKNGRG